jgi:hypothetical protein
MKKRNCEMRNAKWMDMKLEMHASIETCVGYGMNQPTSPSDRTD